MKRLGVLILLFMSLAACNIVVQEAPDETAAPAKAAVFSFSKEWEERQALIPVSLGEEGAGVVEITIIGYALAGASNIPVTWWTIA